MTHNYVPGDLIYFPREGLIIRLTPSFEDMSDPPLSKKTTFLIIQTLSGESTVFPNENNTNGWYAVLTSDGQIGYVFDGWKFVRVSVSGPTECPRSRHNGKG